MKDAYIFQGCFQIVSCHIIFIKSNLFAPSIHELVLSRLVNLALPTCFSNVVPYIYVYLIVLCFLSDKETTALNVIFHWVTEPYQNTLR
jgi:hypothetical protein